MGWLSIIRTILSLTGSLVTFLNNRKLLAAGEAKAIKHQLDNSNEVLQKVLKARRDARKHITNSDSLLDENDPNLRD